MVNSKRRMSLNLLPNLSPSIFYYSLININDYDNKINSKLIKQISSKLDIGYASEDDWDKKFPNTTIKKSQSCNIIESKKTNSILSSLTQSLPLFEHKDFISKYWRNSVTSAYDTGSNPDIDISTDETKKMTSINSSLLMYSKKYTKVKHKSALTSNSYDASTEYTDPEQSEDDVEILSSDLISSSSSSSSSSSNNYYEKPHLLFYNRYETKNKCSLDIELEITTRPSKIIDQPLLHLGRK